LDTSKHNVRRNIRSIQAQAQVQAQMLDSHDEFIDKCG